MKRLPLFPEALQAEVGWTEPESYDSTCARCAFHEGVRTVAMRPEGTAGGLYLIAECPGGVEDATGRPFTGPSGKYLRGLVGKWWTGPVAYDNAVRCAPGSRETKEKQVDACRPYTAKILREVRPQRIVALGGWGAYALLGRKPPVLSLRRAHGWWIDEETYPDPASHVPVYFTVNPAAAARNRFTARDFEADLKWALTEPAPRPRMIGATTWDVCTLEEAVLAVAELRAAEHITLDAETSGVVFDDDFRVECLTLFRKGTLDGYTWDRPALENPETRGPLVSLLSDPRVLLVGHNLTYDVKSVWLEKLLRVDCTRAMHLDTRLLRKLDSGAVPAKLEIAAELVGMGGHKEEAQAHVKAVQTDLAKLAGEPNLKPLKSNKPRKPYEPKALKREDVPEDLLEKLRAGNASTMSYAYRYVPTGVRTRYNARDALATELLAEDLEPRVMAQPNLVRVWEKVQKPAMRAFTRMEMRGVRADVTAIHLFDAHLTAEIDAIEARLKAYGPDVNFDSPRQVAELLYGKLGLPVVKRTETGQPSTDKEAMELLEAKHPIAKDITAHSHLTTVRGTFARGLLTRVRDDGKLHTSFLIDGTDTGRASSHDPNLFNIPSPDRDPVLGKMARDCFAAMPGYVLLESDYSQIELRVAAMISQDQAMIDMFKSGHDFHEGTAKLVAPAAWGVNDWDALDAPTRKKYRATAKNMNFQINYDVQTPEYKLAKDVGCSVEEARRFVGIVMGKFHRLRKTIDNTVLMAKKHGKTVVYLDGEIANVRALPALGESTNNKGAEGRIRNAINASWNTVCQGTAAHFATRSLEPVQLAYDAEGLDAHVVLTVYDSLLTEVREDQWQEAMDIKRQVMTSWPSFGVPIVVDMKVGKQWGSLQKC